MLVANNFCFVLGGLGVILEEAETVPEVSATTKKSSGIVTTLAELSLRKSTFFYFMACIAL